MSERSIDLMAKASCQLEEVTAFFGRLDVADLSRPCTDEGGDSAGETVGAVATHVAEGYHHLGRFLQAGGYVPGAVTEGKRHEHGHAPTDAPGLPSLLERLAGGTVPISLLADLTDEQLDSVPEARSSRFSDGRRTLEQVIDAVIAHQAAHLATLKRAVA